MGVYWYLGKKKSPAPKNEASQYSRDDPLWIAERDSIHNAPWAGGRCGGTGRNAVSRALTLLPRFY